MRKVRIALVVALSSALFSTSALAWRPNGWVYHTGTYAYSIADNEWFYFNTADTQWRVNLGTGQWDMLTDASGWNYHNWPYSYSIDTASWHWFEDNTQWCLGMKSGLWEKFGLIYSVYIPAGMVSVDGGTFVMGNIWGTSNTQELPTHSVTLSSFFISCHEISNEEMRDVMQWAYDHGKLTIDHRGVQNAQGTTKRLFSSTRLTWNGTSFVVASGYENYPCGGVTWYGAAAYCNYRSEKERLPLCYNLSNWSCDHDKKGYRLPTEAEWEYAAKGGKNGTNTEYSGSNNPLLVAWYKSGSGGNPHAVGTKTANELGIFDMSGNVNEWCQDDWHWSYTGAPTDGTSWGGDGGANRVLRGGCWLNTANECRAAYRFQSFPESSSASFGFRCVR